MTIKLTMAQALVRYLQNQFVEIDGKEIPFFGGVWAIFGHGNVAGLGEALYEVRDSFPTYRAHNEQSMAHAAIAYAKTLRRRRAMVCTTSIGPGATNMITAAALAHVNRLPVLLLPGDVFAGRRPDPVLQQIESFSDGVVSANDCFRPVSAYFDRITRPEQILQALPRALSILTSSTDCGPVTLALCQDVQAESYNFPLTFFTPRLWRERRVSPDQYEIESLVEKIKNAKRPVIISGGGVLYARAEHELVAFSNLTGIPVVETQAGKSAMPSDHGNYLGSVGVTGTSVANAAAENADLIIGIGTRLQDFTTGSRGLFKSSGFDLVQVNVSHMDAYKHNAVPVISDAKTALSILANSLEKYKIDESWKAKCQSWLSDWNIHAEKAVSDTGAELPTDAQVVGAVNDLVGDDAIVVCAAGGLPGELHKLWLSGRPGGYHVEYGFSCMGYEIAGGLGVKMAAEDRDVIVMVGDGSYLMANSEIATSVMLGKKITVIVLDNRGYGCINRLQMATGGAEFNNLLITSHHEQLADINFAAHAKSLGARSEFVENIAGLKLALVRAKKSSGTYVICLNTDPYITTEAGGHWWDVAVPEVSNRDEVTQAHKEYSLSLKKHRKGNI